MNTLEESAELILRTMDHLDKRRILVELSQRGEAGLEEIENEMLKRVGQIVCRRWAKSKVNSCGAY